MLKPTLQLRLSQQLTMTPQLQQAIRLLQLPIMDLQTQLREALENNVMLEAVEDTGESQQPTTEEGNQEQQVVVEERWPESPAASPASSWSASDGAPVQEFADRSRETLRNHLWWQLELEGLSSRETAIGEAVIDAINDDGYLTETLDGICEVLRPHVEVALDEAEHVLRCVQRYDPAGVGARSLGECLDIQLRQLAQSTPGLTLARAIAAHHLELMAEQQFATMRRRLRASERELEQALALVRAQHPRPGASIQSGDPQYVVPDVFVRKLDKRWLVEINAATAPRLRVNSTYAGAVGRNGDHAVLRAQLQEARWLVRSLEIRNETLLKVARCIVERQQDFLEHGDEAMHPMVLRDVAEKVDMHESTISRVTTNKYMHTPRGVFEFRHFFSSHVSAADGHERSSIAIRAKIRKMIAQENTRKPLSDNKVAQALKREGINVARRTVAKYREAMSIPPSSERKRLAAR